MTAMDTTSSTHSCHVNELRAAQSFVPSLGPDGNGASAADSRPTGAPQQDVVRLLQERTDMAHLRTAARRTMILAHTSMATSLPGLSASGHHEPFQLNDELRTGQRRLDPWQLASVIDSVLDIVKETNGAVAPAPSTLPKQ